MKNPKSIYAHNFIRVGLCKPVVELGNPRANKNNIKKSLMAVQDGGGWIAVFPELSISGYTCEDVFQQELLLRSCEASLSELMAETCDIDVTAIIGAPISISGKLYNCAVVINRGNIIGIVPKTYIPNSGEFYEYRQFSSSNHALDKFTSYAGQNSIPFGSNLIFSPSGEANFHFFVEICEDLWAAIPPSSFASLRGANLTFNLSASNASIGKSDYRTELIKNQSARTIGAYAYISAGFGESTTDLVWDGHALVAENGNILHESREYGNSDAIIFADIDIGRINADRIRNSSFKQSAIIHKSALSFFEFISFESTPPATNCFELKRNVSKFPYVPTDSRHLFERCKEVIEIQTQGLSRRLLSMNCNKLVLGVSGGLDSTLALLVCCNVFDRLKIPKKNIYAFTMPGFGTSSKTRELALKLMQELGCTDEEVDIRPSCMQMFKDIKHPFGLGEKVFDLTFENVQAGERTNHLFRLASRIGAPVIGTGDLSEIALGWSTYGVGDHMSHYNINGSVPKTLIKALIRYFSDSTTSNELKFLLNEILKLDISPELIPSETLDTIGHKTEDILGPYEMHDFFLYYTLKYGFAPEKIIYLANHAWKKDGNDFIDNDTEHLLNKTFKTFLNRFFETSQYKRSVSVNSPKIGNGGSLSPRGDWRAPSDLSWTLWKEELLKLTN